jgi:hypothetical protein
MAKKTKATEKAEAPAKPAAPYNDEAGSVFMDAPKGRQVLVPAGCSLVITGEKFEMVEGRA